MNAVLIVVPYGTLIPELRAIVYQRSQASLVHTVSQETIFRLDDFLTGFSVGRAEESLPEGERERLRTIYRDRPLDRDLLELCNTLGRAGTPVYLRGIPPVLFDLYRTVLPGSLTVLDVSDALPLADTTHTVIVARDLAVLERTIERGGQGIHYQSASRLQRELELRGLFVPETSSGHIEMSGG
jgi:hypothetical protein